MPSSAPSQPRTAEPFRSRRTSTSPSFLDDTEATLILSDDGVIDHVSTGARRLLDLGSRSLVGGTFFQWIPHDHVGRVARALLDLSPQNDGHLTDLLQLKTGLGPWQWFKVEMTPRRCYEKKAGVILRLFERGRRRNGSQT
mgnify:CR=1 FL=1